MEKFVLSAATKSPRALRTIAEYIQLAYPLLQYSQCVHALRRPHPQALFNAHERARRNLVAALNEQLEALPADTPQEVRLALQQKITYHSGPIDPVLFNARIAEYAQRGVAALKSHTPFRINDAA